MCVCTLNRQQTCTCTCKCLCTFFRIVMCILLNINMLLILHNFTLRCTELGLRIYLPFVWTSTFRAGRLTERGRPGAAKERVDTVRKNERVCYFVQASDVHVHVGLKRRHMYSTCTCTCRCQCHSIVRGCYHRQAALLNSTGTDSFN